MEELDEKGDIRNVPKQIIKEFIAEYKAHPALGQIKNKDLYGNRTLKYKGHQALVNVWKKYDADADIKMGISVIDFQRKKKKMEPVKYDGIRGNVEEFFRSYELMAALQGYEGEAKKIVVGAFCTGPARYFYDKMVDTKKTYDELKMEFTKEF